MNPATGERPPAVVWGRSPRDGHAVQVRDGVRLTGTSGVERVLTITAEGAQESRPDDAALFRVFADTAPTEAGVLQFARLWGPLRSWQIYGDPGDREAPTFKAEPLNVWTDGIRAMQEAVALWELSRQPQVSEDLVRAVQAREGAHNKSVDGLRQGDRTAFSERGLRLVIDICNAHLHEPHVGVQVEPHVRRTKQTLRLLLRPTQLMTALWLQFASAVTRQVDYRACVICGKWMELSPDSHRASRQTCSNRCRLRLSRGLGPG